MRKITFSLLFMLLVSALNAQSIGHDLTIFAEEGEKFTLFINGQQINEQPQSSLSVKDISSNTVHSKIVFENSEITALEKKYLLLAEPGPGEKRPVSVVYKLKKKKEEYKLAFVNRSPKVLQQNNVIIINR